jgi:cGMP-dependent protein kinase
MKGTQKGGSKRDVTEGDGIMGSLKNAVRMGARTGGIKLGAVKGPTEQEEEKEEEAATGSELSQSDRATLQDIFSKHFMLSKLSEEQREVLFGRVVKVSTKTSEPLFSQGDPGTYLFIVKSGQYDVTIDGEFRRTMTELAVFGELALIYNQPRTAAVVCKTQGELWRIHGGILRRMLASIATKFEQATLDFLDQDETFKYMPDIDKKILASSCEVKQYRSGELILGPDRGNLDSIYIVREGSVYVTDSFGNQRRLKQGGIFGGNFTERSQVQEARAASHAVCLVLSSDSTKRLIGEIESVIAAAAHHSSLVTIPWMAQLPPAQQRTVSNAFESATFKDEIVVSSGAPAQLLILVEGTVSVYKGGITDPSSSDDADGVIGELARGEIVGQDQIYHGSAMPNTLVARGVVKVQRINLQKVISCLVDGDIDSLEIAEASVMKLTVIKKTLKDIYLFKQILDKQVTRVAIALKNKLYKKGETIFAEGDNAENFYLIMSGRVSVSITGKGILRTLAKGDYFGERGLIFTEPRSATCAAVDDVEVLQLEASVFIQILGNFRAVLEHRIKLQDTKVEMTDLTAHWIIGQGSFGEVRLVEHKTTGSRYALKCIRKTHIVETGQQKNVQMERKILNQLYHPCIVQSVRTMKDDIYVYFLMEFLGGGDLFTAIREIGMLTTPQAQFYSGSVIHAIEYVHKCRLMYRDLKPENVLLDDEGYVKLVDFGTAKEGLSSFTLVGTPEYLSPEVILGKGYTYAADWWSCGVMMYEFICGPLPFRSKSGDQIELCRAILEAEVKFPSYVKDTNARSILKGLLERRVEQRLASGSMGGLDLMEHPYFKGFDWDGVLSRTLPVPYVPDLVKIREMYVKPENSEGAPLAQLRDDCSSGFSGFGDVEGDGGGDGKKSHAEWDWEF